METLDNLFDNMMENKWVVRIVICEMTEKKPFLNNLLLFFNLASFGLLHAAIQIGPYLIDWVSNSDLRIRKVYDTKHVMMYLYPNPDSCIDPSDSNIRKTIANFIVNFRRTPYSFTTHNCQHFVDKMLEELEIQKLWIRKGERPIRTFISKMIEVSKENYPLQFGSISKNITCHDDLKQFWKDIQEPLVRESRVDPPLAMEVVDLIYSLERGYLARKEITKEEAIDFSAYYDNEGKFKIGNFISYAFVPKSNSPNVILKKS